MSKYGKKYQLSWLTAKDSLTVYVDIWDTEYIVDDAVDISIYSLQAAGNPLVIRTINNDRTKFGIFAKNASIRFISNSTYNVNTFAGAKDDRWLVQISVGSETLFNGFVVLADISQPYLPHPNEVTLLASDNLGLLKERPLINPWGEVAQGHNLLINYLYWCLAKTGLNLPIKSANNIKSYYNSTYSTNNFYDDVYIDAKTFEAEIGECEDCYTVLSKILKDDCVLTQYNGAWWIVRPDDFSNATIRATEYSSGEVVGYSDYNLAKQIGSGHNLIFCDANQILEFERPNKYAKHTYKYEYPKEIPCNIDFGRGDFITDLSSEVVDGETLTAKKYDLPCWTLREGVPGSYGTVDGTTAYIKRLFNNKDYEVSRYVVLTQRSSFETSSTNDATYIESEAIPISKKDKFTGSVDYRLSANISTGGQNMRLFRFVLNGEDGSWWILGKPSDVSGTDDTPTWYDTASWTANSGRGKTTIDYDAGDEIDWSNITWDAPPAPVSGNLYIWLNQFNQDNSSDDNKDIYYSGLSFTYYPYINGSYQKYTGQSTKVERTDTGYSANVSEDVNISDSPKKLFKGALHLYSSSTGSIVLADRFWNSVPFSYGPPPDDTYTHPYEHIRVYSLYNKFRQGPNVITGDVYGLIDDSGKSPDLVHRYLLTDSNINVNNRYFQLVSFEQNWKTCVWSGTFIEVYNTAIGYTYSDPLTFKYITNG